MESLDNLRKMDNDELIALGNGQYGRDYRHNSIADEIEAEIAEKYMLLPVDADGVPIHVGDEVVSFGCKFKVLGIGVNRCGDICAFGNKRNTRLRVEECHHVKPRTLEDVLQCAGVSVAAIEDVAAEIRELMVVGE